MAIRHAFNNPQADGGDATIVRPSNWNADHTIDAATITLAQLADIATSQRAVGRNTAGAGPAELVTGSQILDWVSNTNGVLLTRTGGSWAAVANVAADNGDLVLAENAAPVAPAAGKAKLFGSSSGGRQMVAALAPAGAKAVLQPFVAQKNVGWWVPRGAGALVDTIGANGPTMVGGTGRNPASTSFATGIKRIGLVSAAGAGSVGSARSTAAQYWRGNAANAGGFHVVFRFMISDAVIVTTGRQFVGLQASTAAATDVDPSSFANIVGVGTDANDTVLQLYAAGAAAQARTSLGANFPANTTNADVYELALYCPPNGATITYQLTRLNTGDVASGTISAGAQLPANTTFLTQQMWRSNGVTAAAVGLDLISFYAETDL